MIVLYHMADYMSAALGHTRLFVLVQLPDQDLVQRLVDCLLHCTRAELLLECYKLKSHIYLDIRKLEGLISRLPGRIWKLGSSSFVTFLPRLLIVVM